MGEVGEKPPTMEDHHDLREAQRCAETLARALGGWESSSAIPEVPSTHVPSANIKLQISVKWCKPVGKPMDTSG